MDGDGLRTERSVLILGSTLHTSNAVRSPGDYESHEIASLPTLSTCRDGACPVCFGRSPPPIHPPAPPATPLLTHVFPGQPGKPNVKSNRA